MAEQTTLQSHDTNTPSKKVILIVDDDQTLLDLYIRMFTLAGVEVFVAKDGEEGILMVKEHKPDFVILDIRMPKLDGIEALKIIREDKVLKDTPVMMLTNYGHEEYREATKKLGVVDFIVKTNIDPAGLVGLVMKHLAKRE